MPGRTLLCQGALCVALALLLLSVPSSAQQKCPPVTTTRNPSAAAFRPPFVTTGANGQLVYSNPNYVFGVDRGEFTNVCNVVSANGYYSLAFLPQTHLTYPGVEVQGIDFSTVLADSVGCLVTRSIRGEIMEGMCFDTRMSGYRVPADGCTGVSIQVGRNQQNPGESGLVLSITKPGDPRATWIQGLILGGDTFASFYIDVQGRLAYVADANSQANPSGLVLRNIYKDIPLRDCFYVQSNIVISNMQLNFANERRCDYNCTKAPAFTLNNPTPKPLTTQYQFDTSSSISRTYTKYIESFWEVTTSASTTIDTKVSFSVGLAFRSTNRVSYTGSVSGNYRGSKSTTTSATTSSATTSSFSPFFTVPANKLGTVYQTMCHQTCTIWSTTPVVATIAVDVGSSTQNCSFVTRANLRDTTVYDVYGFSLGFEPAAAQ